MTTDVEQVSQALTDYNRVEAGLAELRKQYEGVVYQVATTEGMDAAKRARLAVREPRYEIERVRKAAKAPLLSIGKRLDSEAARITAELLKIETPIDAQIKREEDRKEAERVAKVEAEKKRVEDIQARIQAIRDFAVRGAGCTSAEIQILESNVTLIGIDESFQEFRQQALDAYHATIGRLREMAEKAKQAEAEAQRVAAERAELERLRRENAERERLDREARQVEERRQQAERDRIALEERQARERQAAEDKRIADDRAQLEADRAAIAAREAAVAEAEKPKPVAMQITGRIPPSDSDLVRAIQDTFDCTATVAIAWVIAAGLRLARERMDAESDR
jgi:DNA repair exonuclease SbcCD ATPase subunit